MADGLATLRAHGQWTSLCLNKKLFHFFSNRITCHWRRSTPICYPNLLGSIFRGGSKGFVLILLIVHLSSLLISIGGFFESQNQRVSFPRQWHCFNKPFMVKPFFHLWSRVFVGVFGLRTLGQIFWWISKAKDFGRAFPEYLRSQWQSLLPDEHLATLVQLGAILDASRLFACLKETRGTRAEWYQSASRGIVKKLSSFNVEHFLRPCITFCFSPNAGINKGILVLDSLGSAIVCAVCSFAVFAPTTLDASKLHHSHSEGLAMEKILARSADLARSF